MKARGMPELEKVRAVHYKPFIYNGLRIQPEALPDPTWARGMSLFLYI
jgi:hypothetical protein